MKTKLQKALDDSTDPEGVKRFVMAIAESACRLRDELTVALGTPYMRVYLQRSRMKGLENYRMDDRDLNRILSAAAKGFGEKCDAWEKLGKEMGFDGNTASPRGKKGLPYFKAVPGGYHA